MVSGDTSRRVWFMTGTSSGMGRGLALAALRRGDRVVATARDTSTLDDLTERFPGQVLTLRLDVRDEEAARRAAETSVDAFGGIDVVFNNAGYASVGSVEGTGDRQARDMFDTGFFGVLNVMRAALPVLRRQRSGHVLQMSSLFGHVSLPAVGLVSAVKQAVNGATQAMAAELAPLGVKFTQIEPGGLKTDFLAKWVAAETEIADYDRTVGPAMELLRNLPPEAVAEVSRAATAIFEIVETEKPPMHLVLGGWANGIVREELTGRIADLDNWAYLTEEYDAGSG
ncbi:SDR family NAD(P)-dependent oxidoreductase [Streptomyces liangshanensis]|uniref:SDR family NAD(P)-dependent oxidoreductase n=1 Tax=Streptomyces liangshanensis TaxID=2717324 RepID=UPI0036DB6065